MIPSFNNGILLTFNSFESIIFEILFFRIFNMNRRKFFKNGSLFALGTSILNPFDLTASTKDFDTLKKNNKAKNIIVIVSDGMSTGTLNMADLYLSRKTGTGSNWLQLYKENKVNRALMDMASASSIVTDSAAASSSWGGGFRINNGGLNVGPNGKPLTYLAKI